MKRLVKLDGKMQENNQISQGRIGDRIVHRQTDGSQGKRQDIWMDGVPRVH